MHRMFYRCLWARLKPSVVFITDAGPIQSSWQNAPVEKLGPFMAIGKWVLLAHTISSSQSFTSNGPVRILGQAFILVASGPIRDCVQNIFIGPFVCIRYMFTMGPRGLCQDTRYICTRVLPRTTNMGATWARDEYIFKDRSAQWFHMEWPLLFCQFSA